MWRVETLQEEKRRVQLLQMLTAMIGAGVLACMAGVAIAGVIDPDTSFLEPVLVYTTPMLALCAVVYVVAGRYHLAAATFVAGYTLWAGWVTYGVLGFRGSIPAGFVSAVSMAGLLIGPRAGFVAAGVASLLFVAAWPLEDTGIIQPLRFSPTVESVLHATMLVVAFYCVATAVWLATRELSFALGLARRRAVLLAQDNRRLLTETERLADDLDERTRVARALWADQTQLLQAVQALAAPVLDLADGAVLMPLVGPLDERRARAALATLREQAARRRAAIGVLDLSAAVANTEVLKFIFGAKPVGRLIVSGIAGADELKRAGVTTNGVVTCRDLSVAVAIVMNARGREPARQ